MDITLSLFLQFVFYNFISNAKIQNNCDVQVGFITQYKNSTPNKKKVRPNSIQARRQVCILGRGVLFRRKWTFSLAFREKVDFLSAFWEKVDLFSCFFVESVLFHMFTACRGHVPLKF